MKIKLVLSGTGSLFPIHCGVKKALEYNDIEVIELACVSGGAIVGGLIANGYDALSIERIIKEFNFKKIYDYSWNPIFAKGLLKGKNLEKEFNKFIDFKFSDSPIPIHIFATDLNTRQSFCFNAENTPDTRLSHAIRCSMSLPVIFKPVELDNMLLIDGGVFNNFPIDHFDYENLLGIRVRPVLSGQKEMKSIFDVIGATIDSFVVAHELEHIEDANYNSVLEINVDRNSLEFNLANKDINDMIDLGFQETEKWLKQRRF